MGRYYILYECNNALKPISYTVIQSELSYQNPYLLYVISNQQVRTMIIGIDSRRLQIFVLHYKLHWCQSTILWMVKNLPTYDFSKI